ncbi:transcriptional antiterminator [Sporomusaceae bacterium BoRhaA]|uniref:BglG family transcription antiterminator n=1 Tax=Pelorhabdus rhamnosifermentans TaxID=2772457 RepID=UPI001C05FDAD|nr:transcription antiterminator [Pelorhabdus rhamnosifermentans]MBU2699321.1 transcriptional antiterminator [Pelorhabdus rhamnosifermentans]
MLTYRCRQILKRIIDAKRPLRVAELAEELQVSVRAIKYDLDTIRLWLQKGTSQCVHLKSKPHKGVWLEGDESELNKLTCVIAEEEGPNMLLNQEERMKYIILEMLVADGYTTINWLMSKTGVSRNTIVSDLKKVEQFLKCWNIQLDGKAHRGMSIKAAEVDLRVALEYLIQSFFSSSDMAYLMQSLSQNREIPVRIGQVIEKFLLQYQDIHVVYQTVKCIIRQGWDGKTPVSERVILGLFIRVCVVIQRLKSKHELLFFTVSMQKIEENSLYLLIQEECTLLSSCLGIEIPEEEVQYIWLQLHDGLGQGMPEISIHGQPLVMTTITTEIIAGVSALAQVPFYEEIELFDSLMAHLTDRLAKYQHRVLDPNPLVTEVIHNYGKMFDYVKVICLRTLSVFNIVLSDDDLAYIVLHFQAAYEQRFKHHKYKALVVCGTGRGNARLLKVRLENEIKSLHVIGCYSVLEVDKALDNYSVDLVISVLPLDIVHQTVIINALPTESDIQAIYNVLEKIEPHHLETLDCKTRQQSRFLETLSMIRASINPHDLLFAENMSREIINQGIQIASLLVMQFKQHLTEQAMFGLTVHILLMVNRLAFGSPYEEPDIDSSTENDHLAKFRQQLVDILSENYPDIPDGEISAILRYFS